MKIIRAAVFLLWGVISLCCAAQNQVRIKPFVSMSAIPAFCGGLACNSADFHATDQLRVTLSWDVGSVTDPANPNSQFGLCTPFLGLYLACEGDIELSGDLGDNLDSTILPGGVLAPGTCNVGPNPHFFIPINYIATYLQPGVYTVKATLLACKTNPDNPATQIPTNFVLATTTFTFAVLPIDAASDFADSVDFGPCHQCESSVGAPINVTTGNVYVTARDLSIPGLGGGLELGRIWNSLLPYGHVPQISGMFGDGWRSSFEESLQFLGNGQIRYWRGDGSSRDFTFVSATDTSESFALTRPSDEHASLLFDFNLNKIFITFSDGTVSTFAQPNANSFTYMLSAVADRNGNTTTLAYDSGSASLLTVSAPSGAVMSFTYGNPNFPALVTLVTSPAGNVQYFYDNAGRLTSAKYADQSTINYSWDSQALLTAVTDSGAHVIEAHTYDAGRRGLTSNRGSGSDAVQVTYSTGSARLQTSRQSATAFSYFSLNGRRLLSSVTGPGCASCGAKNTAGYTYDAAGNRTSITDALGHVANFTYDSQGNVLTRSALLPDGTAQTWKYSYNIFNQVTSSTDPLGNTTIFIYDPRGNLTSVISPPPAAP